MSKQDNSNQSKPNKKNNILIILIPVILMILIVAIIFVYLLTNQNKTTENDTAEQVTSNIEDNKNNSDVSSNENSKISFYYKKDDDRSYYFSKNEEKDELITAYQCENIDCDADIFTLDESEYAIVYDNSTLYYYQLGKDKTFTKLEAVSTYTDMASAIRIKTYTINDKEYYMAFLNEKHIFDNSDVKELEEAKLGDYEIKFFNSKAIVASNENIRIIDLIAKKRLLKSEIELPYEFKIKVNTDNKAFVYVYFSSEYTTDDEYDVILLSSDFQKIYFTKNSLISLKKDNVYFASNNKYYIYNSNGKKIKESESFKKIYNINDKYVTVITEDNLFKMLDADTGKVVADFGKWRSYYEAYYGEPEDYNSEDGTIIYIPVYIKDEVFEFYYDKTTGEYGKQDF